MYNDYFGYMYIITICSASRLVIETNLSKKEVNISTYYLHILIIIFIEIKQIKLKVV